MCSIHTHSVQKNEMRRKSPSSPAYAPRTAKHDRTHFDDASAVAYSVPETRQRHGGLAFLSFQQSRTTVSSSQAVQIVACARVPLLAHLEGVSILVDLVTLTPISPLLYAPPSLPLMPLRCLYGHVRRFASAAEWQFETDNELTRVQSLMHSGIEHRPWILWCVPRFCVLSRPKLSVCFSPMRVRLPMSHFGALTP